MVKAPVETAEVKVIFARNASLVPSVAGAKTVAIVPDPDEWNDYSWRLYARLHIRSDQAHLEQRVGLMFEGQSSSYQYLQELHEALGSVFEPEAVQSSFVTLQHSPENYATMVEALGFDAAITALRRLHDAALARVEADEETIRPTQTTAFATGVIQHKWREATLAAGLDGLHFHDLRGTTCTLLAEAGATPSEIAAVLGWTVTTVNQMLDTYQSMTASLSDSAVAKLERKAL